MKRVICLCVFAVCVIFAQCTIAQARSAWNDYECTLAGDYATDGSFRRNCFGYSENPFGVETPRLNYDNSLVSAQRVAELREKMMKERRESSERRMWSIFRLIGAFGVLVFLKGLRGGG